MTDLFKNNNRSKLKMVNDKVFYMVYGADTTESNKALAALLNVVLHRDEDPIVDVRVMNTVDKGVLLTNKETVMDIRAGARSGQRFNVEMQGGHFEYYADRSLFYGGRMVNSSLETGDDYGTMKQSVVVSFIDGIIFKQTDKLHTEFYSLEKNEHFPLTDKLAIHFLELGKLDENKNPADLTAEERLCAYLKYAGDKDKEDYLLELFETNEEVINMSEDRFRELSEDERVQEWLWRQEIAEHDKASQIAETRAKGIQIGIEQGREVGIRAVIEIYQELDLTKETAAAKLAEKFQISAQQAEEYLEQYWK